MKTALTLALIMLTTTAFAQNSSKSKILAARPKSSVYENNIRFFPSNTLEGSLHLGFERNFRDKFALGFEGNQTVNTRSMLYPEIDFQETYFGPLVQYYMFKEFEGLFVEGGVNYAHAKISAHVGLNNESLTKEQSYFMPHVTTNYRLRWGGGFTATGGLGLFSFVGGDELKIDEKREGFVDGAYVEKTTKVETPYSASPKLRVRLDMGYSF